MVKWCILYSMVWEVFFTILDSVYCVSGQTVVVVARVKWCV